MVRWAWWDLRERPLEQAVPDRVGGSEVMSICMDLTFRKEDPLSTRVRARLCVDVDATPNN